MALALLAAGLLPAVTVACSRLPSARVRPGTRANAEEWTFGRKIVDVTVLVGVGLVVGGAACWGLAKGRSHIGRLGEEQARFCDDLPRPLVGPAIIGSAAASLVLELAVIRWQGTVFEVFSFYKNLSLLACFLGLGLGYALARRPQILLPLAIPLVAVQVGVLLFLRHGLDPMRRSSLGGLPVREQLGMGVSTSGTLPEFVAVYGFLAAVFLLTALAFLPVGQLCGRLMDRAVTLRGYGLNLLGSLLGVGLMFAVSDFWLPPEIWFTLALGMLLPFLGFRRRALAIGIGGLLAVECLLAMPVSITWERIYSPYQLLERGPGENGLSMIRAAGQYFQRIHNLSTKVTSTTPDDGIRLTAAYYEFPYRVHRVPPEDVAIVGAGTGNDVAAALRMGASTVDAVEIDPAIVLMGRRFHPEAPYDDRRVEVVVDDARSFLRTTGRRFDMIVYGLLDSHTLLSHASNVRLDSFVYTVEGLREARARLKPGGLLSLSFSVISPELGHKIYLMLTEAFDGRPPTCIRGRYNYDGSVIFLQREGADVALPEDDPSGGGFTDVTAFFANPSLRADVSTDDWPFFYMPKRVYPVSYLGMVALILAASVVLLAGLVRERPAFSDARYFLLGAGFMLIQTKGITELGLAFGNTWRVVGIVIAAMLVFAFLANVLVARWGLRDARLSMILLLASLGIGLGVSHAGGLGPGPVGRIGTAILLTCPVFFSGITFSTLIAGTTNLSRSMASNLFGALCGGLLESNSMYFGLRSLYWIALGLYGLAFLLSLRGPARQSAPATAELAQTVPLRNDPGGETGSAAVASVNS